MVQFRFAIFQKSFWTSNVTTLRERNKAWVQAKRTALKFRTEEQNQDIWIDKSQILWSIRKGFNKKMNTKRETYREPPPMAATESTFATPLTGDENICMLGANACCCDDRLPIATGWSRAWDPTAEIPPCNANDLDGKPPKAWRIESSRSSKALFGAALTKPSAGEDVRDPLTLGGGGRAGGAAALLWPSLAFSPANNVCCPSLASSVKNGFSSLPAACG